MSTHQLIAGALYDFMGRLTSQDEEVVLSSHHEPHRLLDIFKAWAAERRLNVEDADVQRWQFRIPDETPVCTAPLADGPCLGPAGHEGDHLVR